MHIQLLLLGKTRRPEIRGLIEDYAGRIGRFAQIEVRELREDSPSALRKLAVPPGATVAMLDAAGKKFDSRQFAAWLGSCRDQGVRDLIFLCGAAEGFPDVLSKHATVRLSLSPLTFSHELARVMLAEQLYRAFTMLAGHPYAK